MPTDLALRNTQNASPNVDLSVIGTNVVYDMVTAFGSAADTAVVNTVSGGTEIIWTKTAGGNTIAWISGRVPAGGFTLTSTFLSIWARESNMNANCGGRYRVFRYQPGPPATLTELGGGPFNDGVEFGTSATEMTWTGNVTDTTFAENDRIVLKVYITNVGKMGGGFTCTLTFNAASGATGDSFFQIAETVTFKGEPVAYTLTAGSGSYGVSGASASLEYGRKITADPGSYGLAGSSAVLRKGYPLIAGSGSYGLTGAVAGLRHDKKMTADAGSYSHTGSAAALSRGRKLAAESGSYGTTGSPAALRAARRLALAAGAYTHAGNAAALKAGRLMPAGGGSYSLLGSDLTLTHGGGGAPRKKRSDIKIALRRLKR